MRLFLNSQVKDIINEFSRLFPGNSGDKNLPAGVEGDMVSIPGPGRSHMPWNNQACEPQLLSLHALESVLHNKEKEATTMRIPHTTTRK